MTTPMWCWLAAGALILVLLAVDFAVHRGESAPTLRKALLVSGGWIAVSVAFGLVLGGMGGWESAGSISASI